MRTQLCLILEPKWFKLTTCDWIRRILKRSNLNRTYLSGKYPDSLICVYCVQYASRYSYSTIWYCGMKQTKPELMLLERLVTTKIPRFHLAQGSSTPNNLMGRGLTMWEPSLFRGDPLSHSKRLQTGIFGFSQIETGAKGVAMATT